MSALLDRSRAPALEPAQSFAFPEFERRRLDSGLEILCLRTKSLPMVHLQLLAPAGGEHAPADSPGLPSFTAALLDEGTAHRTGPEIAAEIERLGGYLGSGAGWNATAIEAEVLAQDLGTGLSLVAEVAREPSFPEPEVGRVRRQFQTEITRRRSQPSSVAREHFDRLLFEGTVYATPLIGTTESLERLDRESVASFFSRYLTPQGSTLIAVGGFDAGELFERAEAAFAGWAGEPVTAPSIEPARAEGQRLEIVDRPDAAQTEIRVGHVGISRNHRRYLRAALLNCLLGGKFTSRLNLNLRETHGFTYGVHSSFGKRSGPAPFVVSTALANEHVGAALAEIFGELHRLREEAPSEGEIADTKDYLIGSFPYSVETLNGLASRLSDLAVYDLPDDYYEHWADQLRAVTGSDLLETARELLRPDTATVVCVGPADELRSQLEERFEAPVTVVRADPE